MIFYKGTKILTKTELLIYFVELFADIRIKFHQLYFKAIKIKSDNKLFKFFTLNTLTVLWVPLEVSWGAPLVLPLVPLLFQAFLSAPEKKIT